MLISLAILLVPFAFLRGGVIHLGHQWGFVIVALLVLSTQVRNIWIKLFIWYTTIWTLFILITNLYDPVSFIRSYEAYKFLTYIIIVFLIYQGVLKSKCKKKTFYLLIRISILVQLSLAWIQYFGFDPITFYLDGVKSGGGTTIGSLGNTNFLAAYVAIGAPFFLSGRWRWFLIPISLMLLVSNTTTAVLSAACGVGAYFGLKWVVYLFGLSSLFPIFLDEGVFIECPRWGWWSTALQDMVSVPSSLFVGFGPAADTGLKFPLHNEWLEMLYHFGIVGLVLVAGYIRSIVNTGDRMLLGALIAVLVNCLGNYPLHLAPSLLLILVIFALMEKDKWQITYHTQS